MGITAVAAFLVALGAVLLFAGTAAHNWGLGSIAAGCVGLLVAFIGKSFVDRDRRS